MRSQPVVVELAFRPALSTGLGEWRPPQAPGMCMGGLPLLSEKWTGRGIHRLAVPGSLL